MLTLGDDATIGLRNEPSPKVEAPIVFAGYGLQVPEASYDDLAGLNLKGKVVSCDRRSRRFRDRSSRTTIDALVLPEKSRRGRRDGDSQPERAGHSLGSLEARAVSTVHRDRRTRARRDSRSSRWR